MYTYVCAIHQVHLINSMEDVLFSPLFSYFPDIIQQLLRSKLKGLQHHYNYVYNIRPFDPNDRMVTEDLKKSLYDNCVK